VGGLAAITYQLDPNLKPQTIRGKQFSNKVNLSSLSGH
jgi:hypothetical protein